jgi:ABC-type antimicrobial peptide transport system permease subunit
MIYRPLMQTLSTDGMTLHVRAAIDPDAVIGTIRRELQILDRNVPLVQITTLEAELNASFSQTRQAAVLTSAFGILALLMSAVGIYAVTALTVRRETRNIGIRLALGAGGREILRVVTRRGVAMVMTGLALGLIGSYGFVEIAGALLFGVTTGDIVTVAGIAAVLIAVCLIAIYVPAKAATRLDPVAAIRYE